jgi:hypothetical protein
VFSLMDAVGMDLTFQRPQRGRTFDFEPVEHPLDPRDEIEVHSFEVAVVLRLAGRWTHG